MSAIIDRPRVGFMFVNRSTAERCQRCSRELPHFSERKESSIDMCVYDRGLPKGQQLIFDLGLCSACATWLADRIYARAHDGRISCRRKNSAWAKRPASMRGGE
jgi:hypothetical protein